MRLWCLLVAACGACSGPNECPELAPLEATFVSAYATDGSQLDASELVQFNQGTLSIEQGDGLPVDATVDLRPDLRRLSLLRANKDCAGGEDWTGFYSVSGTRVATHGWMAVDADTVVFEYEDARVLPTVLVYARQP